MRKFNVAAIAVFALGVGLLAGPAISAGQSNVINACVNKSTGLLRIAKKCTKSEKPLSWNQRGIQGEQGLPGVPGEIVQSTINGASPIGSLNCFQKIIQADNSGFIWNKLEDRRNFESQTGCQVRDIDLNPNSQIPNFYRNYEQAQVTSSKFLGLQFTSGGETTANGSALYEVSVNNSTSKSLCSPSTYSRVYKNPSTGKTYAIGHITTNQFRNKTLIALGLGESTTTVTRFRGSNFAVENDYGGGFVFESMIQSMPKGASAIVKLISVWHGGSQWDFDANPAHVEISGGNLAKVTKLTDEVGYLGVYEIQTNDKEIGNTELTMTLISEEEGEVNYASQPISVGVKNCYTFGELGSEVLFRDGPLDPLSSAYLIIESGTLPNNDPFEQARRVGWTFGSWFD